MAQIRFALDSEKMPNPDLDIRYLLPERLAALPDSSMTDNGYDYSDDDPPLLMIFVNSDVPDADVERSIGYLSANPLLDNDVLAAVVISTSEDGGNWRQVYPSAWPPDTVRPPGRAAFDRVRGSLGFVESIVIQRVFLRHEQRRPIGPVGGGNLHPCAFNVHLYQLRLH